MSWRFWVKHFRNETQGRRDSKFNYRLPDGTVYTGLHPPEGAEAYVGRHQDYRIVELLAHENRLIGSACTIPVVPPLADLRKSMQTPFRPPQMKM